MQTSFYNTQVKFQDRNMLDMRWTYKMLNRSVSKLSLMCAVVGFRIFNEAVSDKRI